MYSHSSVVLYSSNCVDYVGHGNILSSYLFDTDKHISSSAIIITLGKYDNQTNIYLAGYSELFHIISHETHNNRIIAAALSTGRTIFCNQNNDMCNNALMINYFIGVGILYTRKEVHPKYVIHFLRSLNTHDNFVVFMMHYKRCINIELSPYKNIFEYLFPENMQYKIYKKNLRLINYECGIINKIPNIDFDVTNMILFKLFGQMMYLLRGSLKKVVPIKKYKLIKKNESINI